MNEDPGFAAFWAIYPKRSGGPYGAEKDFVNSVLLGQNARELISHDEVGIWLRGLDLAPVQ